MPPKAKFTKEEVITAAVQIVERDGIEGLTARALGQKLGSSARPIFTVFNGMEEVVAAVYARANCVYGEFVVQGLKQTPAFKGVGTAYIRFAAERPRLFQLLFMKERQQTPDVNNALLTIEEHYEEIISSIENGYGLDRKTAIELYFHLWVYSHGIAVLLATKVCAFTERQISEKLTSVFTALLKKIKTEGKL